MRRNFDLNFPLGACFIAPPLLSAPRCSGVTLGSISYSVVNEDQSRARWQRRLSEIPAVDASASAPTEPVVGARLAAGLEVQRNISRTQLRTRARVWVPARCTRGISACVFRCLCVVNARQCACAHVCMRGDPRSPPGKGERAAAVAATAMRPRMAWWLATIMSR